MPTATDFLNLIQAGGVLAFAVLVIYGFLSEKIVPRGRLEDERAQRVEALTLLKQGLAAMDRLSDAVEARNRLEEERLRLEMMREQRKP